MRWYSPIFYTTVCHSGSRSGRRCIPSFASRHVHYPQGSDPFTSKNQDHHPRLSDYSSGMFEQFIAILFHNLSMLRKDRSLSRSDGTPFIVGGLWTHPKLRSTTVLSIGIYDISPIGPRCPLIRTGKKKKITALGPQPAMTPSAYIIRPPSHLATACFLIPCRDLMSASPADIADQTQFLERLTIVEPFKLLCGPSTTVMDDYSEFLSIRDRKAVLDATSI
jgi:hypothetical protein